MVDTEEKDLAELESDLQELGEVAYRAENKAKLVGEDLKSLNEKAREQLTSLTNQITALERQVPDLFQRLQENSEIDKDQRKQLTELFGDFEKLKFSIKEIDRRLAPETGKSYETLMSQLVEVSELLDGDKDDDTVPSYRKLRAEVVDITRSVLGSSTVKSLDVFRSEYYAAQNQSEGLKGFIGVIGPYAIPVLISAAGFLVFDRISGLEEQIQIQQSHIQSIEYKVGAAGVQGTLEKDLDDNWDYTNDLGASFQELTLDMMLRTQASIDSLQNQSFTPPATAEPTAFSPAQVNAISFTEPIDKLTVDSWLGEMALEGYRPSELFDLNGAIMGCDKETGFRATCEPTFGGPGEWR